MMTPPTRKIAPVRHIRSPQPSSDLTHSIVIVIPQIATTSYGCALPSSIPQILLAHPNHNHPHKSITPPLPASTTAGQRMSNVSATLRRGRSVCALPPSPHSPSVLSVALSIGSKGDCRSLLVSHLWSSDVVSRCWVRDDIDEVIVDISFLEFRHGARRIVRFVEDVHGVGFIGL
jgi:hypothetical protein